MDSVRKFNLSCPTSLKAEELVSVLKEANELYRRGEESGLTDSQFDALKEGLRRLDPNHPFLKEISGFSGELKVKLPYKLYSLNNVDWEELLSWASKVDGYLLIAMPKFDGISCLLDNGKGYTRGDGERGMDITRLVGEIPNGQKFLNSKLSLRGELLITPKNFEGGSYDKPYKNPRNAVAGLFNYQSKTPKGLDSVSFIPYQALGTSQFQSKSEILDFFHSEFGVSIPYHLTSVGALNKDILEELFLRWKNDFGIDGIVFEVNDLKKYNEMGLESNKNPKGARAYKEDFEEKAETTIDKIIFQPTMTGTLVPVGVVEPPVVLEGALVKRVSLYNYKNLLDSGIYPGCKIILKRSKGVNPKVHKVLDPNPVHFMNHKIEGTYFDGVHLMAREGFFSDEIKEKKLLHFFKTLKVEIGEPTIKALFLSGFKTPQDICFMKKEDWLGLLGVQDKMSEFYLKEIREKVFSSIKSHFMVASGCFEDIGITTMNSILDNGGIDNLDKLTSIYGIGEETARNFRAGLGEFIDFENLFYPYLKYRKLEKVGEDFKGKVFCFSGFRSDELKTKIESLGGVVKSSVTADVNCLVLKNEESGGSKRATAEARNIEIKFLKDLL